MYGHISGYGNTGKIKFKHLIRVIQVSTENTHTTGISKGRCIRRNRQKIAILLGIFK